MIDITILQLGHSVTLTGDQAAGIAEEIASLRSQNAELDNEASTLLDTYNQLSGQVDSQAAEITRLQGEVDKANERAKELESENVNGNAATELLIWWAQKLSNAPNEDLKDVIRIGYRRILNLASIVGDIQIRKGGDS